MAVPGRRGQGRGRLEQPRPVAAAADGGQDEGGLAPVALAVQQGAPVGEVAGEDGEVVQVGRDLAGGEGVVDARVAVDPDLVD